MSRRTQLFVLNPETPDDQITAHAEAAAARDDHLGCLLLGAAPSLPWAAYGVPPYGAMNVPDDWADRIAEANARQSERVDQIEALLQKSGVSAHVQSVLGPTVEIRRHVGRAACVSDTAILAPGLRDVPDTLREAAYGVLFHSPIGLRLNAGPDDRNERIFIAWDSSAAAARAVHVALPDLEAAKEVSILCIDPVMSQDGQGQNPGADLAAWLSHHGCKVVVHQMPSGGRTTSECIRERAAEGGADLVVMGAYGHARFIEAVFGGTTRRMIDQTEMPVLLAH